MYCTFVYEQSTNCKSKYEIYIKIYKIKKNCFKKDEKSIKNNNQIKSRGKICKSIAGYETVKGNFFLQKA